MPHLRADKVSHWHERREYCALEATLLAAQFRLPANDLILAIRSACGCATYDEARPWLPVSIDTALPRLSPSREWEWLP
jgi:hypothetical protein